MLLMQILEEICTQSEVDRPVRSVVVVGHSYVWRLGEYMSQQDKPELSNLGLSDRSGSLRRTQRCKTSRR